MKIAVLISGEYRTFDICRKHMSFLNDGNVDVYISTWNKTIYSNSKINLYVEETVTRSRIENILSRSAVIDIEESPIGLEKYCSKMIYKWLRSAALIKNISYDYVLFVRPDILFNDASNIIDNLNMHKESIGVPWCSPTQLHDFFFIVPGSHLKELLPTTLLESWISDTNTEWHTWWYNHVKKTSLNVAFITDPRDFTICRYSNTEYNTFPEYVELYNDWRHLHKLNHIDIIGLEAALKIWSLAAITKATRLWNNGELDKYIITR